MSIHILARSAAMSNAPDVDPLDLTAESIASAYAFNCEERDALGFPRLPAPDVAPSAFYRPANPTMEQRAVLAATDGLYTLIQQYGVDRVQRWVKTLATIAGQEVS